MSYWGRPLSPEELQRRSSAHRSGFGAQTTMTDLPSTRMREGQWMNQQLDTPYGQAFGSTFQPYSWANTPPAAAPAEAMPAQYSSPSQNLSTPQPPPAVALAGSTGNSAQQAMRWADGYNADKEEEFGSRANYRSAMRRQGFRMQIGGVPRQSEADRRAPVKFQRSPSNWTVW